MEISILVVIGMIVLYCAITLRGMEKDSLLTSLVVLRTEKLLNQIAFENFGNSEQLGPSIANTPNITPPIFRSLDGRYAASSPEELMKKIVDGVPPNVPPEEAERWRKLMENDTDEPEDWQGDK